MFIKVVEQVDPKLEEPMCLLDTKVEEPYIDLDEPSTVLDERESRVNNLR